jgi:DNA-binding protein H-NS
MIGPDKTARKTGSTGKKVAAKKRRPTTGEGGGRGLQPKWLKAALAGGKKIEDFAV